MSDQVSAAVSAALCCDWEKAAEINTQLLKTNPKNIDSLNRLGKALLELGEKDRAITIFKKILRINKYDSIAQKNLERAKVSNASKLIKPLAKSLTTNFLEEPGKTKLVSLVNVSSASILFKLGYGDGIKLTPKRHTVIVADQNDTYIGAIPDDLGHRLSILITAGNRYDGLIKSVSKNSVVVFLREISKTKKFRSTPSFSVAGNDYLSFVREDPQHEGPVVTTTGSDDDDAEDDTIHHTHQDEETEE